MIWRFTKKLVFLFDAEKVHGLSVAVMKCLGKIPFLLRLLTGAQPSVAFHKQARLRTLSKKIWQLHFNHPLGLAAGFDKNAELLEHAENLGFAFWEIGTVTPRPQPGNEKPRLFRKPQKLALFNRMGFNNEGVDEAAQRIEAFRKKHPNSTLVIGSNIGKNKDTPAELAPEDYALCAARLGNVSDYMVINVSSPNTPGLRDLQQLDSLKAIVEAVKGTLHTTENPNCPLLLKLAPELATEALKDTIEAADAWDVQGYVLTNTWGGTHGRLQGGWSGEPVQQASLNALKYARAATSNTLISVGGILTPEDAMERLDAGADLLQVYTGWIYGGPSFPSEIVNSLATNWTK